MVIINGEFVGSELCASTFADYLESVKWPVRPATLVDGPPIFPELSVTADPISLEELSEAAAALVDDNAAGLDR